MVFKKNKFLLNIYFKIKDILISLLIFINIHYYRKIIKKKYLTNSSFGSISIDTTNYFSDLCVMGGKFGTDKSILNEKTNSQHSYTGVYSLLFNNLRKKKLNIAEIGILNNQSIKTLKRYFVNSCIYGFDYDKKLLAISKKIGLKNVKYNFIDVRDKNSINHAFKQTKVKFDIIIDDSTHDFNDQINIIHLARFFLKKNGFLIIEDIATKKYSESLYYKKLKKLRSYFEDIYFVNCIHKYNFSILSFNHKILVLKK